MVAVPVYVPATCDTLGCAVAPRKTYRNPVLLKVAEVADADGVKVVPDADELVVLYNATQLAMGSVLEPLAMLLGSVNVRFTLALFCPCTANAAAPLAVTATELLRPGKTWPKLRSLFLVTVIGCCTLAVTF